MKLCVVIPCFNHPDTVAGVARVDQNRLSKTGDDQRGGSAFRIDEIDVQSYLLCLRGQSEEDKTEK